MKLKLDKERLIAYMIFSLSCVIFISIICLYFNESNYSNSTFGRVIVLPFLFITLFSFHIAKIKIYNYYTLIFILLYILHFGQLVVSSIFPHYKFTFDISLQLNFDDFYSAQIYSLLFLMFYVATGLVCYRGYGYIDVKTKDNNNLLKNVTVISLCIFFPLQLFLWYKGIMIRISENYLDTLASTNNGFIELFAKFHILGIIGLLIIYKNQTIKKQLVIFSYCLLLLISMLTGGRMYSISLLIVVISFYLIVNNVKLNIKKLCIGGIILFLLFDLLSSISKFRNENVSDINELVTLVRKQENMPIYDFISEMGGTQFTMGLLLKKERLGMIEYSYGKSYMLTVLSVLPNLNNRIKNIQDENNFVLKLNYPTLGGSAIAESFYNFGWYGCIVGSIIAYMVLKAERRIYDSFSQNKLANVFFQIIVIYAIILWQRNTMQVLARYMVYAYFFILLCNKIKVIQFNRRK